MNSNRNSSVNDGIFNVSGLDDSTAKPPFTSTISSITETDLSLIENFEQRPGITIPNSESVHFRYETEYRETRPAAVQNQNPLFRCPCIHYAISTLVTSPDNFHEFIQPYFQNLAIYNEDPEKLKSSLSKIIKDFKESSICEKDKDLYTRLNYFNDQMSRKCQTDRRHSVAVSRIGDQQANRTRGNSLPVIEGMNLTFNEKSELILKGAKKSKLEDLCEISQSDSNQEKNGIVGEISELDLNARPLFDSTHNGECGLVGQKIWIYFKN